METQKSLIRRCCAPIAFAAALFSGSALLLLLINYVVPEPYMDEIFHVDQMRRYCGGRFDEWNDKITTPPALYFASYAIWCCVDRVTHTAWAKSFSEDLLTFDCKSVTSLRFLNLLFLTALYFAVSDILKLQWNLDKSKSIKASSGKSIILFATALNLCFFPVLYFTAFLYYTDVLSILTVMAMYLFHLRRWRMISALFGSCSCAVRQTNIIWVAFCCYLTVVEVLTENLSQVGEKRRSGRHKRLDADKKLQGIDYQNDILAVLTKLKRCVDLSLWSELWTISARCLRATVSYILVGIGFVAFVVWNGGVALGDRSAHQASAHFVQFLYCALFICFFGLAVVATKSTIAAVLRFFVRRPLYAMLATAVALVMIYGFTYDHPYLLADNRHYTFYIWRRWFMRHAVMKYLLTPAYVCAFVAVAKSLSSRSVLWRTGFLGCIFLATVPNRLFELRYFILPYFFWRLNVSPLSKFRLGSEFLFFLIINAATFALFILKPFKWSNSDQWQRFMW